MFYPCLQLHLSEDKHPFICIFYRYIWSATVTFKVLTMCKRDFQSQSCISSKNIECIETRTENIKWWKMQTITDYHRPPCTIIGAIYHVRAKTKRAYKLAVANPKMKFWLKYFLIFIFLTLLISFSTINSPRLVHHHDQVNAMILQNGHIPSVKDSGD